MHSCVLPIIFILVVWFILVSILGNLCLFYGIYVICHNKISIVVDVSRDGYIRAPKQKHFHRNHLIIRIFTKLYQNCGQIRDWSAPKSWAPSTRSVRSVSVFVSLLTFRIQFTISCYHVGFAENNIKEIKKDIGNPES